MIETTVEEKVTIFDKITDNIIAIIMTVGIVLMAIFSIPVPNWLATMFGMVIAYFFKK